MIRYYDSSLYGKKYYAPDGAFKYAMQPDGSGFRGAKMLQDGEAAKRKVTLNGYYTNSPLSGDRMLQTTDSGDFCWICLSDGEWQEYTETGGDSNGSGQQGGKSGGSSDGSTNSSGGNDKITLGWGEDNWKNKLLIGLVAFLTVAALLGSDDK